MTSAESENRWNERQNIRLGVSLIEDGQEILHAISKDISLGGIFLNFLNTSDSDTPAEQLDIDKKISVTFTLRNATGEQHHSLPARIVRHHDDGTALAFSDYDIHALSALRVLLYDGASSTAH